MDWKEPLMDDVLLVDREGVVLTLTLNRPRAHNAINSHLAVALTEQLQAADRDPAVRLLLLKADGQGSFCSGVDLREGGAAAFANAEGRNAVAEIIRAMLACRKLILAQIEGAVIGGGVGLISACDLIYAAEDVKFSLPEVKVGLFPLVATSLLSRQIPARKLRELAYLAGSLTAAEAVSYGLINETAPRSDLDNVVREAITRLLSAAPQALIAGKRALAEIGVLGPDLALSYAELQLGRLSAGDEAREGRAAFSEKRKPRWVQGQCLVSGDTPGESAREGQLNRP